MLTHTCKLLLVSLSLLLVGACDLKPEFVGATLPDAGGASTTDDTTTGNTTGDAPTGDATGSSPGATTTAAPDGTPCELGPAEAWEETAMPDPDAPIEYNVLTVTQSTDCAGGVCLFAAHVNPPSCKNDSECAGDVRLTGICGEFQCEVDTAWGEAHTTCTSTCEVDTDCPVVPGCVEGPICTVVSKLGSQCCKKLCACRDELSEGDLENVEWDCQSQTHCQ